MSRRIEWLIYGLVACVQVLTAHLALTHFSGREAGAHAAVVHVAGPGAASSSRGGG